MINLKDLSLKGSLNILFVSATMKKYNPYINYTWQMLPNAKVKNSGTSGVDLQLYSGNPLDFQGSQYIPYVCTFEKERTLSFGISFYDLPNWKAFPILGNTINSNRIYFSTKNTGTATFEIDNRALGESNTSPLSTLNFAIGTYYHITLTFKDRIVKCYINGVLDKTTTTAFSGLYFQQLLANLNRSEYVDAQMDYLIIKDKITTQEQITQSVEQPNQFFKDMSTAANTLFATDFRGNSSNIKDYKSGMTYPITNYSATQRTNFTQESKGLQELMRERDSLGFFLGLREFPKGNGVGYGDGQNITLDGYFGIEIVFKHNYTATSEWDWLAYVGDDMANYPLVIATQANKVRCSLGSWFTDMVTPTKRVLNVGYNHIYIERDENGDCHFVVNGVYETTTTNNTTVVSNKKLWLFKKGKDYFSDEIKVFKIHKTSQDPIELYNNAQGLLT